MNGDTIITLSFEGEVTLRPENVWPNHPGEAPEVVTPADVLAAIKADKITSLRGLLEDWCLGECITTTVTVVRPNPIRGSVDLFTNETAPDVIVESMEVRW